MFLLTFLYFFKGALCIFYRAVNKQQDGSFKEKITVCKANMILRCPLNPHAPKNGTLPIETI